VALKELAAVGARLAFAGLSFAIAVVLARWLGPAGFGDYAMAVSLTSLAVVLAVGSLPIVLVREVSKALVDRSPARAFGLAEASLRRVTRLGALGGGVLALVAFAGWSSGFSWWLPVLVSVPAVPLIARATLLEAGTRSWGGVVNGQFGELLVRPSAQLAAVGAVLIVITGVPNPSWAAATFTFGALAYLLSAHVWARSWQPAIRGDPGVEPVRGPTGRSLIAAIWLEAAQAHMVVILLATISTTEAAGEFKAVMQLGIVMIIVIKAMNLLHAPQISRLFESGNVREMRRVLRSAQIKSALAALPVLALFVTKPDGTLGFLFGEAYTDGSRALQIVATGQFVNSALGMVTVAAQAARLDRQVVVWQALGGVVSIALVVVLVRDFGAAGAAVGWASGVLVYKFGLFVGVRRHLRRGNAD
jgi:O-antigen/teichoic acid export membrane protein